jgi:peptidylprolyl isomerase
VKHSQKSFAWILTAAVAVSMLGLAGCQSKAKKATAISTPTATTPAVLAGTQEPTQEPYVLAGAITTQDGLQYLEEVSGDGPSPVAGDTVVMNYIVTYPDGTEIYNTYTIHQPTTAVMGSNQLLPGWEEGVGLMKQGGKAKFVLPPELAFGSQGNGAIPPDTQLIMEVVLISVKPTPVPVSVATDQLKPMANGEQYYDIIVGDGTEAISGTTVTMAYSMWVVGTSTDDFIISSDASQPVTFVLGRGDKVFKGWEDGVIGMKIGGERQLVIPPELALGAQGSGQIPANATLIMEIKLANVQMIKTRTVIDPHDYVSLPHSLLYYDIRVGTGITPTVGQTVVVSYTGWLMDGTQFDSSDDRGQPFSFVFGKGNVIPGWDLGMASMKVGGKRQIVIPPALAYGDTGMGGSITVPPGSALILEVELLEVK